MSVFKLQMVPLYRFRGSRRLPVPAGDLESGRKEEKTQSSQGHFTESTEKEGSGRGGELGLWQLLGANFDGRRYTVAD